jgi:hypothetical protein
VRVLRIDAEVETEKLLLFCVILSEAKDLARKRLSRNVGKAIGFAKLLQSGALRN